MPARACASYVSKGSTKRPPVKLNARVVSAGPS
jgi:hypothetical protein